MENGKNNRYKSFISIKKAWEYARKEAHQLVDVVIVSTTAKAVAVVYGGGMLWFGKSILVNGKVPVWAYKQKVEQYNMINR